MTALPTSRPRSRPRALTSSASRLGGPDATEYSRRLGLPWQRRALTYIDLVPEVNYASRFYGKMLQKIKLSPGLMDASEKVTPIESGLPVEILSRIQDPGGGRTQMLDSFGRLMFASGEGLLWGTYLGDPNREAWRFIWNDELQITYGSEDGEEDRVSLYQWRPSPREPWQNFYPESSGQGPAAVAYRFWRPHPALSGEADAPMRAALEVSEELIILTTSVRATAVSRMTNGILLIPSEISPPSAAPIGDEDPLNNPLIADFAAHMEAQVENAGSASASAPFLLEAAFEYLSGIKWLKTHDPATDYMERELRKEALERLGYGLDMPPEVLRGFSESNHWAARQILEDMWRSHGDGVAKLFANGVNQSFLQPMLREAGFADWRKVTIIIDASEVMVQPDRSQDADSAADRGMIGDKGYRILKNIPEEYAPTEDERRRWEAVKLRDPLLLGTGDAQVGEPGGQPPPPGPEGDSGRQTRVVRASASMREEGAADLAVTRCRELAGVRIRQKAKGKVDTAPTTAPTMVAAAAGREALEQWSLSAPDLVRGGADSLRQLLSEWGYRAGDVRLIGDMVEKFAAETLFERAQPRLPAWLAAKFEMMEEAA